MSGPLSVPFAGLALWVSGHFQKTLWGCLAAVCAVFASYRVWRRERQTAAEGLKTVINEKDRRIQELMQEVARLQIRPFDAARREAGQAILNNLTVQHRDLLRFLVRRGRTTAFVINGATQLDQAETRRLLDQLRGQDLIGREVDNMNGIVYFWVNRNWSPIFEDLLFPRNEQVFPEAFREQ